MSAGSEMNSRRTGASSAQRLSASHGGRVRTPRVHGVTRIDDYRHPDADSAPLLVRPDLSAREIEVLLAWLGADSKDDVAEALFISASTVSTHVARIRAKYAAVGRAAPTKTHLFARALQDGYTSLDNW